MLATATQPMHCPADRPQLRKAPLPRGPGWAGSGEVLPQVEELQRRYRRALQTLAETRARAEQAERRLRSRLVELTWPAALCGIVGGFATVVGLRLGGL